MLAAGALACCGGVAGAWRAAGGPCGGQAEALEAKAGEGGGLVGSVAALLGLLHVGRSSLCCACPASPPAHEQSQGDGERAYSDESSCSCQHITYALLLMQAAGINQNALVYALCSLDLQSQAGLGSAEERQP